jgi:hypothetical protein
MPALALWYHIKKYGKGHAKSLKQTTNKLKSSLINHFIENGLKPALCCNLLGKKFWVFRSMLQMVWDETNETNVTNKNVIIFTDINIIRAEMAVFVAHLTQLYSNGFCNVFNKPKPLNSWGKQLT